ncbi:MAG TPA: proline dehydrogenase family protein [Actinomycetota bacterium]|nr:proline dehydrogenase family protein [Actinomycetota bacterium]
MSLSTSLLRPAIVRVAHHPWARRFVTGTPPGRAVASRFVAGETLADAMAVARDLHGHGIRTMLDHLGEHVTTPEQALGAREAYLSALEASAAAPDVDPAVSVKLTQLGLDESIEACWANLLPIVAAARERGSVLMIDMEESIYVDRTLEIAARAHAEYAAAGVAIQAALRRSERDLFALAPGTRIRLVKGAYLEPEEIAFTSKREVDASYARLFATSWARGHPVDVATHDPRLIEGVRARVEAAPEGWGRVEIQMLYGVRRDLQSQLAGRDVPVRVYIPYGTEWYPYLTRRLVERPANVWFFVSNLMRTSR